MKSPDITQYRHRLGSSLFGSTTMASPTQHIYLRLELTDVTLGRIVALLGVELSDRISDFTGLAWQEGRVLFEFFGELPLGRSHPSEMVAQALKERLVREVRLLAGRLEDARRGDICPHKGSPVAGGEACEKSNVRSRSFA